MQARAVEMFEKFSENKNGPLKGFVIVEIAGIGPAPFCGMVLADLGATVIRVDRVSAVSGSNVDESDEISKTNKTDILNRNKYSIGVDLKSPKAVEIVLKLCEAADGFLEGFRPGVAEKLGIGPKNCLSRNPKLVYGRMTGWGQEGPMAPWAGHDINYIALSGVLSGIGRSEGPPVPPMNLLGDFGGGGMYLAMGMLAGILNAQKSNQGQIVDAAMVDGAAILASMIFGMKALGFWTDKKGENLLDTGAHFYEVYETKDGQYISVGAIEPQFYAEFIRLGEIDDPEFNNQWDRNNWPNLKEKLKKKFLTKTLNEWVDLYKDSDACVAPVLTMDDAHENEHIKFRKTYVEVEGVLQPAPGPRFSETSLSNPTPPPMPGVHTREVLAAMNYSENDLNDLFGQGIVK